MPAVRVLKAGAVAVRTDGAEPRFLLVTAKRHPERWIFPKGHVERGETTEQAALRELVEEAGVRGEVLGELGTIEAAGRRGPVRMVFYLARFVSQGAPEAGRRRRWASYDAARAALWFEESKVLLDRAVRALAI